MTRARLSTRERQRCFDDANGICHLCEMPIAPGEGFEVSHPIPLAAGGDDTPDNRRPAHVKCHARQTATIDAPRIAKTKRQRAKHTGAYRPKSSLSNSRLKKKMDGSVVDRRTGEPV